MLVDKFENATMTAPESTENDGQTNLTEVVSTHTVVGNDAILVEAAVL